MADRQRALSGASAASLDTVLNSAKRRRQGEAAASMPVAAPSTALPGIPAASWLREGAHNTEDDDDVWEEAVGRADAGTLTSDGCQGPVGTQDDDDDSEWEDAYIPGSFTPPGADLAAVGDSNITIEVANEEIDVASAQALPLEEPLPIVKTSGPGHESKSSFVRPSCMFENKRSDNMYLISHSVSFIKCS